MPIIDSVDNWQHLIYCFPTKFVRCQTFLVYAVMNPFNRGKIHFQLSQTVFGESFGKFLSWESLPCPCRSCTELHPRRPFTPACSSRCRSPETASHQTERAAATTGRNTICSLYFLPLYAGNRTGMDWNRLLDDAWCMFPYIPRKANFISVFVLLDQLLEKYQLSLENKWRTFVNIS